MGTDVQGYGMTLFRIPHRERDHGNVAEAFERSLKKLDCGYIDLYLMHWPQAEAPDGKPSFSVQ